MVNSDDDYSTDHYVDDYRKKLNQLQKIFKIKAKSNIVDLNYQSLDSDDDIADDFNEDFNDSVTQMESQLIAQFREYKTIKLKLEEIKRQLHLANQIQVSIDTLKSVEFASQEKKEQLTNAYNQKKEEFDNELTTMQKSIEQLKDKRIKMRQFIDQELIIKKDGLRVDFEINQSLHFEQLQVSFIIQKQECSDLIRESQNEYDDFLFDLDQRKKDYEKRYEITYNHVLSEYDKKKIARTNDTYLNQATA